MSKSDDVRFTRDGDQFHYLWAARRCLKLLSSNDTLVAVVIEGASGSEMPGQEQVVDGEEVIDVAEYHGSTVLAEATAVRYVQLKHSTVNSTTEWTMSGLKVTLSGFARRFEKIRKATDGAALVHEIGFVFATNRPISIDVRNAIEDARNQREPRDATATKGLAKYTGLSGSDLSAFCAKLSLEPEHDGFLVQRKALASELRGYLPGGDSEAFLQIKDLVTRKATSEYAANPAITRLDILRVVGCDDDDLFPAKNLITPPKFIIPRESETSLVQSIVDAGIAPVIIHAEGGVGKSVFASRIGEHLPPGSATIVYDCFGNGQYRSPSNPRHGAGQALVQVANELAARELCRPIIPSGRADDAAYFRAFCVRISQAILSLQEVNKDALLCIVIDAADNAEMAAAESGEAQSFVRKLIRETFPSGVRLVMLCRTHRRHLLSPPPSAVEVTLPVFSWGETAAKLRGAFPNASDQDVHEFHRLSSQNPRVQSTALATAADMQEMLRNLGPEPKTVDDMIGRLLEHAVLRIKDEVPKELIVQFDRICTALAVLRPMIPLSVVASVVQISTENLRSFLADLGQSILVKGELLQFRDEPTETWFQERFKPDQGALRDFIAVLRPQASVSAYVAATLPHLLLQAGQMDELIIIALSSSDLPSAHTLETREIEAQRLHFALRASLKCKRYLDATKLALSAAGLAATEDRQWQTLQANTDLAGNFLAPEQILSVVSGKEFSGSWTGAHHVYDACVLSFVGGFQGDAQSHIRMAEEWLKNMSSLSEEERQREHIDVGDISALVLASLNVYGPERAAFMIGRCRTSQFRYSVASMVGSRLTNGGRLADLDEISLSGSHDTALLAAFITEAAKVGHLLPKEAVRCAWSVATRIADQGKSRNLDMDGEAATLLTALAWMVVKLEISPPQKVAAAMERHLGTHRLRSLGFQHDRSGPTLVKAYTLQARLSGRSIKLLDLAYHEWHEALTNGGYKTDEREIREFKARAGALMPWYQLWADIITGEFSEEDVTARLMQAESESNAALQTNYWDKHELRNDIVVAHIEVLFALGKEALPHIKSLQIKLAKNEYFTNTLITIVRISAKHPDLNALALDISSKVADYIETSNEQAELRADYWIALSRALLTAHVHESKFYFLKSIDVASKIGEENLWRWNAMIHLAQASYSLEQPQPQLAYRFSRCAELAYDFVHRDKHFDWQGTVEVIASLCPSSAFSILSRWSDRGFGSRQLLLARVVEHLASQHRLSPALTAALFGFQAEWAVSDIFSVVMENSDADADRRKLAAFLYRYILLKKNGEDTWKTIRDAGANFNIKFSDIESFVRHAAHQNSTRDLHEKERPLVTQSSETDWDDVFAELEIASLPALAEAYQRYSVVHTYDRGNNFYAQAAIRIPLGRETEFLQSLQDFPRFELFELRYLLKAIPHSWRKQLSTMAAVQSMVKTLISRHSLGISVNRHYQTLPLDMVEQETHLSVAASIGLALESIAETGSQLGAEPLFELVGLLAKMLNNADATAALDFELTRLEGAMDDTVGDGPWSEALKPPMEVDDAVAGYVWRALAAPERDYRWQAAHVVRALCELNCVRAIDSLLGWLGSSPPAQFMDKNLIHYRLHAHLWLLIGVARAALDETNILEKHLQLFVTYAVDGGEQNVLIRGCAAQTALVIAASNPGLMRPETLEQLRCINEPTLSPAAPTRDEKLKARRNQKSNNVKQGLHFGIDFPSYWFDPLATRFGLSGGEMCGRVEDVILNDFKISATQWDDDQRHRRKYYEYEETSHSHGSYPKSDDLHFYLSFHAMMAVAGELLATIPLAPPIDEDDDYYTFQYWLRQYGLTRSDGRWLADRRDPEPLEYADWHRERDDKEWRWTVEKSHFSSFLLFEPDFITVSGQWLQSSGSRRQEVAVSSALVSADAAEALLVASQTTSDFHLATSLPRAGESDDELIKGFELLGWVTWGERNDGLDEYDPWAAKIHFPPMAPAVEVCELLEMTSDSEHRLWYRHNDKTPAMKSRTWGNQPFEDRSEQEPNHGLLLQASMSTLTELMKKTGQSIMFKVRISRRLSYSYKNGEDDEVKYSAPYILYFLLDENEDFITL